MGTCQKIGCNNKIFSHSYCRLHQWLRTDEAYKKQKEYAKENRKAKKQIPKESPKRKKDNRRYRERLDDRWNEAVINKTNYCFFCGELMEQREDNHHLGGRGVTILDETLWVWVHRECHSKYHSCTTEQLMQESWYEGWLARLALKDLSSYHKELQKREKSEDLFGNVE